MPLRYISRRLGIEYLEIPKAACSSIKQAMLYTDGISITHRDLDYIEYWRYGPDRKPPPVSLRFTFVRNPLTRFISFYRNKIRRGYLAAYSYLPQKEAGPFETLQWIKKHLESSTHPDKHVQVQSVLLRRRHRSKPEDAVYRYEELDVVWVEMQTAFPGLADLPHLNPSEGDVQLGNPELDLLYEIYREDFETFGYSL